MTADRSLYQMIMLSTVLHIGIVAFFTLKLALFPSEAIDYQAAVRVDLVALPDKVTEPSAITKEEPVKVETPATPEKSEPVEKAVKKSEKVDLTKRQKSALDKIKAQEKAKRALEELMKQSKSTTQVKGNVISVGTALKGINKMDYDSYIGDLDQHIKNHWVLPEWLANAPLRARALVKIDENGFVIEKRLILPSGNSSYDNLVMDAIDQSSPFPKPPEKFKDLVGVSGIIFQFPD